MPVILQLVQADLQLSLQQITGSFRTVSKHVLHARHKGLSIHDNAGIR